MAAGAIVPAGAGRTIFVLPWLGQTLIGTTDTDHDGAVDHVQPVRRARSPTCSTPSTRSSPPRSTSATSSGAYAGVRPLISTGDPRKSVDISRKAELYETSSGMVTITGGKLTTWRRMAKETVDRIVVARRLGDQVPHARGPARDAGRPRGPAWPPRRRRASSSPAATATSPTTCSRRARPELAEPIVAGRPDLLAEVAYAARREQARTVGDVLLRRTRLGLTAARGAARIPGARDRARRGRDGRRAGVGSTARVRARGVDAFREEARAEGILPGA